MEEGQGSRGYNHAISMVVRCRGKKCINELKRLHTELLLERSMYGNRIQSLPGVKTEGGW